jgi:hypothetical protein
MLDYCDFDARYRAGRGNNYRRDHRKGSVYRDGPPAAGVLGYKATDIRAVSEVSSYTLRLARRNLTDRGKIGYVRANKDLYKSNIGKRKRLSVCPNLRLNPVNCHAFHGKSLV